MWGKVLDRKRNKTEKSNEMSSAFSSGEMSVLNLENREKKMSASSHAINISSHRYQSSSFVGGLGVNPTLVVTLRSALSSST